MNTIPESVIYTLKEKFFLIEPEGRIRRYQFLVRILAPGFLLFLIFAAGGIFFSSQIFLLGLSFPKGFITGMILVGIFFSYIFYKVSFVLYTKRCHDFGNDGAFIRPLVLTIFGVKVLSAIITILGIYGFDILPMNILISIDNLVNGVSVILTLILLFKKGVAGENQYGKDPISTRISFLG